MPVNKFNTVHIGSLVHNELYVLGGHTIDTQLPGYMLVSRLILRPQNLVKPARTFISVTT